MRVSHVRAAPHAAFLCPTPRHAVAQQQRVDAQPGRSAGSQEVLEQVACVAQLFDLGAREPSDEVL